ncbi:MAG: hypothetical protein SQA66_06635 [Candidatus Fervidibacter sacchari]
MHLLVACMPLWLGHAAKVGCYYATTFCVSTRRAGGRCYCRAKNGSDWRIAIGE